MAYNLCDWIPLRLFQINRKQCRENTLNLQEPCQPTTRYAAYVCKQKQSSSITLAVIFACHHGLLFNTAYQPRNNYAQRRVLVRVFFPLKNHGKNCDRGRYEGYECYEM
jgi:hypothetical protein